MGTNLFYKKHFNFNLIFFASTCLVSFIITTIAVSVSVTESLPLPWQPPKEIANKLHQDPDTKTQASDDFGHIIHQTPLAVLYPDSIFDIASLINFSNSLPTPFTISSRGNGHSVRGQAMAYNGVVINMTQLAKNGTRIVVSQGKAPFYADVGAEQLWIDVLHATLEHGLAPRSWTDYLYLTVGGTLSNAGISGQTFKFGPQISNLNEIDVLTGKGEFFTCSAEKNSGLFYSALGGLGQFGIITRARILLQPAPTRVKWVHLFYNNFSTFSGDQERLITVEKNNGADYIEGQLLLNQLPLDLSFYPIKDRPRISSLVKKEGIIYIIELVKHYTDETKEAVEKEAQQLVGDLNFTPEFMFEKDATYEEFLDRVHADELVLRSKGLWYHPHPWLNIFVPKSRVSDFDLGVFRNIILKQNLTAGIILIYPVNRNKWDNRMSAVTPDEDIFYIVGILPTSGFDQSETFDVQNNEILQFCENSGIQIKTYLPEYKTQEEWMKHFGPKWNKFQKAKTLFDPKHILSPGQGIFNNKLLTMF